MSIFVAMSSRMRTALLVAATAGVPALALAQGTSASRARPQSIVVTAPSIRVRTAPSMLSISIEEVSRGQVFALASDENHSKDWVGIVLDGRIAFLPRYSIGLRSQPVQSAAATSSASFVQAGMPAPVTPAPARYAAPAPAASATVAALPP
ncbi:MAG TPA: hypothetical protein VFN38_15925, partial [Gemmatimonadaceae bacterium]|nr:hypothetical protein [Gemmatimonadaceae bacterium]